MIDPKVVQVSSLRSKTRVVSKAQDFCLTVASQLCLGVVLQINHKPFIFVLYFDLVFLPVSGAETAKGKSLSECSAQGDVRRREKEIPIHMPY